MEASAATSRPALPIGLQVARALLYLIGVTAIIRPLAAPFGGEPPVRYAVLVITSFISGALAVTAAYELGKRRRRGFQLLGALAVLSLATAVAREAFLLIPLVVWGGLIGLVWLNRRALTTRTEA